MDVKAIERLLPWVIQRTLDNPDNPINGFLNVMSGLRAPVEAEYLRLHTYLSPYTTPDDFLPYLARMMNLSRYLADDPPYLMTGITHLRNLIALSVRLSQQRGTVHALQRFLEVTTGIDGFRVEEHVRAFHVRIYAPPGAMAYQELMTRIIEGEKPAYVTFELLEEQPQDDRPADPGASGSN